MTVEDSLYRPSRAGLLATSGWCHGTPPADRRRCMPRPSWSLFYSCPIRRERFGPTFGGCRLLLSRLSLPIMLRETVVPRQGKVRSDHQSPRRAGRG